MLENDFEIDMKVGYNQNRVMILYSDRYKNIKNFFDKVGFTIGRKRKTLEFCLRNYKRKGLRSYDKEFKLKCLNMLRDGYSAYEIGKLLDFPYTNIYDFVKQTEKGG